MDESKIYREPDAPPETVQMPQPTISIEPLEDILENIATYLNTHDDVDHPFLDHLDNHENGEITVGDLEHALPEPLMGSSFPLLSQIKLTAYPKDDLTQEDISYIENRTVDVLTHEAMHLALYHVCDKETSEALDNLHNVTDSIGGI